LGGLAVTTIAGLPLIRGYYFYGAGDSLTHLGWMRMMDAGQLAPTALLYPGIHTVTVFVEAVAGVQLPLANLYAVSVLFPLLFLLFVPLAVQILGGGRRGLGIGLLAAALFVPINNISVHPVAHPASQGVLFLPFVLYLLLVYTVPTATDGQNATGRTPVTDGGRGTSWWDGSAAGIAGVGTLLALASVAIVLVHPQQAVNVALVFVAVTVLQLVYSRWHADHPIAGHRPLTFQTVVIVAAILAWAPRFPRVTGAFRAVVFGVLRQGATTGEVVAQRSGSLTTVGGSIPELFVKLFFPSLVFSLLALGLVVVALRRFADAPGVNSLVVYVAAGLVPLFGIFLLMLAARSGDQYFRYIGFMMVPVTVLGAAALGRWSDGLDAGRASRLGAIGLVVLFAVLLPVGLLSTHPSPYMYQPTSHVTEAEYSGYESSFEQMERDVAFTGVRGGPRRFVDAHYGTQRALTTLAFPGYRSPVGEEIFKQANYTDAYDEPRYMAISTVTHDREVNLYDGFRYPERSFQALEATPNVNRVRSSEGFDLYRIDGDEDGT
jgi:hypothetical protein